MPVAKSPGAEEGGFLGDTHWAAETPTLPPPLPPQTLKNLNPTWSSSSPRWDLTPALHWRPGVCRLLSTLALVLFCALHPVGQ